MEDWKSWGAVKVSEEQSREWLGEMALGDLIDEKTNRGYGTKDLSIFEKLMSVEEVADALRIAPQTLRNWVAMRRVPFIRIGGKTRFRWKSVEAWLERKEFQQWQ